MSKYSGSVKSGTFFKPLYRNGKMDANLWNHRFGFTIEADYDEGSGREFMKIYETEGFTTCPNKCKGGAPTRKRLIMTQYEDGEVIYHKG